MRYNKYTRTIGVLESSLLSEDTKMDKLVTYRRILGNDIVNSDLRTIGDAIALYPNGNVKTGSFPIPHNLATDSEIVENVPVSLNELIERIESRKRDRQIAEDRQFEEMLRLENLENMVSNSLIIESPNISDRQLLKNQMTFLQCIIGDFDNE